MDGRIRELQDLIARYSSFMEEHDTKFAGVEVHYGCRTRMEKIIDKWRHELTQLQENAAAAS